MSELTLHIGSQVYRGWREISVTTGIEQLAGQFDLTLALRNQLGSLPDDLKCAVNIDGQPVVTGFVDDDIETISPAEHSAQVTGRDATGDLVDSSAAIEGSSWTNRTLDQIARDLVAPFEIPVVVATDVGAPFAYEHTQPGETIYEQLARGARMRGVLLTTDGLGRLVITREGTDRVGRIRLGKEIKQAVRIRTRRDRFQRYLCRGQVPGTDLHNGDVATQPSSEITDAQIRRKRLLIIDVLDPADDAECKQIAQWEKTQRIGRSEAIEATVKGWTFNGKPWRPNTRIEIDLRPLVRELQTLLIAQVNYRIGRDGEVATLRLVPLGTFDAPALAERDPAA